MIAFLGYKHSPKWFNIKRENKNVIQLKHSIVNSKNLFIIKKNTIKRGYCTSSSSTKLEIPSSPLAPHPCGCVVGAVTVPSPLAPPTTLHPSGAEQVVVQVAKQESGAGGETLKTTINELGLTPVYFYENLGSANIKKQILEDTKNLSGIYMIFNKITKDYYIGSAPTNRFYSRFSNHLIYYRGSKIVKLAVKKYNLKNFAFIILELFPDVVTQKNNKNLMDLEDKYLKLLLPNYNILTEAGYSFGYKHTEVDRKKLKDIYSEVRCERAVSFNLGKKLSRETIEKIRAKALNSPPLLAPLALPAPPFRDGGAGELSNGAGMGETKLKCIRHTRPVLLYNLNGTIYGEYTTIFSAAKAINCNEKTIRRALQTEKKIVKRQ